MRHLVLLLASLVLVGCSHVRPTWGASPQHARERRAVLGEGVLVEATRWDTMLVDSAAAEHDHGDRKALRERLQARYVAGTTAFTVVLELRDRPEGMHGLDTPEAWWFELDHAGTRTRAAQVELLAVDRFPAGSGRAHLRIAFDVRFTGRRAGELDLRIGAVRPEQRLRGNAGRAELAGSLARHGALLHWDAG